MKAGTVPLTEDSERSLDALRRAIARAQRFSLYVVVAADRARGEALARLAAWSGAGGVPELLFLPSGAGAAPALSELLLDATAKAPVSGVVIPDADRLVEEGAPVLGLNVLRDRLSEFVAGPLILVLSPRAEVELVQMAPDLFDVRAATCEVVEQSAPESSLAESLAHRDAVEVEEPLGSVASEEELRALEAREEPPPPTALADAWLRLAKANQYLGDPAVSERAATEAARLAEGSGYLRGEANAFLYLADAQIERGELEEAGRSVARSIAIAEELSDASLRARGRGLSAEILAMRGQLDEALRIRKELLPVYEELGDIRERAVTMGRIADILQARGQLDEALRIQKEDVLPVYEKLGDIRERAVAMGRIAHILGARGQLDEALRIQKEDELPVYEKLGHRRSMLVARANIALHLLQRDANGDRKEAKALLSLALQDALEMRLPEADQIQRIMRRHHFSLKESE